MAGVWIVAAWVINLTIVGLPLGIWMIDRIPQILTLKARGGDYIMRKDGQVVGFEGSAQYPFIIRALYFVVIGWWASLFWAALGWLLCLTIVGIPFGLPMLYTLPFITSLHRN